MITVGDNIYGSEGPQDFVRKFEAPYKPLLDAGVKFYASLGNHDRGSSASTSRSTWTAEPTTRSRRRRRRALLRARERLPRPDAAAWLQKELQKLERGLEDSLLPPSALFVGWTARLGSAQREALEPLFVKYNVSVVFTGHDHFYERVKPQQGIVYFVVGSAASCARATSTSTGSPPLTTTEQAFLIAEMIGDELYFNAISRRGP